VAVSPEDIRIPTDLLPADGRFGSGPSRVRKAQVDALAGVWQTYLGTSHRQKTVKSQVGRLRTGLADLFSLRGTRSSSATVAPPRSGTSRRSA
jgi:phosphoserine aminotransferase